MTSTKKGICWYRGYFRKDPPQEEVQRGLDKFHAKSIIVGHTLQSKVNKSYDGKVIDIDVHHPKDYIKSWPNLQSDGLLIDGDQYFRVLYTGESGRCKLVGIGKAKRTFVPWNQFVFHNLPIHLALFLIS